ncbi:hypothetical protein N7462_006007 [Penicillium macrosclerotiorum]|uniref:uncharacterized protein n=1 Tax=Penicillium macrosclerotiorum TaxID=303699 RepID=UPI002547359A|nr:uncharacterized protein N7462_006007 [Penicillium macrosclerotiorum]KAJ5682842.1 hypothetical protein N7462_006007 [Penicillium macrosclerotiorum]
MTVKILTVDIVPRIFELFEAQLRIADAWMDDGLRMPVCLRFLSHGYRHRSPPSISVKHAGTEFVRGSNPALPTAGPSPDNFLGPEGLENKQAAGSSESSRFQSSSRNS